MHGVYHASRLYAKHTFVLCIERVFVSAQLAQVLCHNLIAVFIVRRLLKGIVLQRNNNLLHIKCYLLEGKGGIGIAHVVLLHIVGAIEERKGKVLLVVGHLYSSRICHGNVFIAIVGAVVIYHNVVHKVALIP